MDQWQHNVTMRPRPATARLADWELLLLGADPEAVGAWLKDIGLGPHAKVRAQAPLPHST